MTEKIVHAQEKIPLNFIQTSKNNRRYIKQNLGPVHTYPDNYYPILSEESFIG